MVADSLERHDGGTWQLEALSNICPACFDISPGEDNAVAISIDGNQQHVRFKDKSSYEYEKLPPKLFVDYGRRNFGLAGSVSAGRMAGCGNKFKATSGWNKAEAMAQSKKALDETGLMAATCFHGTNIRFMNVYGGNERYSHVIRLLESIEAECPAAGPIRLCYDVACEFESSLRRHNAPWVDRVQVSVDKYLIGHVSNCLQVRIGRFHLYGHEMKCHILYNLLRTEGFGLMVGEEVEQLWSMLGSLVKTGRVSSGPRRSQIIDASGG
jgi:hypothetical protein